MPCTARPSVAASIAASGDILSAFDQGLGLLDQDPIGPRPLHPLCDPVRDLSPTSLELYVLIRAPQTVPSSPLLISCKEAAPVTSELAHHWSLATYIIGVVVICAIMLGASYLLGGRTWGRAKNDPFESGVESVGTARLRISAKFYLVTM